MQSGQARHERQRGVSLVDLLLGSAVVGVIAAAALPSYQQYTLRAQRGEARNELLQSAAALERCFGLHGAYNHPACASIAGLPRTLASGHYLLSVAAADVSNYRLTAVPQGAQAKDEECRSFSLDSSRHQGVSEDASRSANYCWAPR